MSAATFGDCKCGFPKDAHSAAAFASGAKKKAERDSKELRDEICVKTYADCAKYEVNLESANFGECKCGRPKSEHSPEALAKNALAGKTAGTTKQDENAVRSRMVTKKKVECTKYEPNLTAGEFGICKCGHRRADHTGAALAADTGAKSAKKDADASLAGFIKREVASCPKFVLNMDPSAPFGTCTCGRPRTEHSEAALAADSGPTTVTKKTSDVLRKEMAAKEQTIGTAVETMGGKTEVAFGIGNTVRTAAQENAAVMAAINARAGGADKAAALNDFNEMMKDAAASPAA